jgi:DNA polymerase-3 subunit alpha
MFGAAGSSSGPVATPQRADWPRWSTAERLTAERESLGLWLSGHPIEAYETELQRLVDCRLADVQRFEGRNVRIAGLVVGSRTLSKGRRMTFVTLDDRTARLDVTLFDEQLAGAPDLLARDRLLVVEGAVSVDDFNGGFRIRAEKALPLPAARAGRGAALWCQLAAAQAPADLPARLAEVLGAFRGPCPVLVDCRTQAASGLLRLGADFQVRAEDALIERLRALPGVAAAEFRYDPPPRMPAVRAAAAPLLRVVPRLADSLTDALADTAD